MGMIVKDLEVTGDKGKKRLRALFDTGASGSLIKKRICEEISSFISLPQIREYATADEKIKISAKDFVVLNVAIDNTNLFYHFVVVEELSEELVIGSDMMQRCKIKLDTEKKEVLIDKRALELKIIRTNLYAGFAQEL